MKILHIISGMDPVKGGVGQAVRTLVAGLQEAGMHNEVLCLDDPASEFIKYDPFISHAKGPGKRPWYYSKDFSVWLQANLLKFDNVIVHGLWQYHGYATYKAFRHFQNLNKRNASDRKIPGLFVMPHGMLDPYFQKAKSRKLKAVRNWLYWKLIESKLVNLADGLLFTCEVELLLARQPFSPYRPKVEIVIGLGVDQPPSYTEVMRDEVERSIPSLSVYPYLLYLGRIHEKKGVDLLINAYAELAKKDSSFRNMRLVIAGPGMETDYGKKLQGIVNANTDLSELVIFAGMVTGNLKWGLLYCCEAFVLPSHQENFGIAVVESMAAGKAVLISNQVNIWQEINKAGAGISANDDFQGTLSMLEKWKGLSAEQKQVMNDNARNCYSEYFSSGPVAQRLMSAMMLEPALVQ